MEQPKIPADRPYLSIEECSDLAFKSLQKANVHILDEDVENLAESIKVAIDSWFGDMKHLSPKYRPQW